MSDIENQVRGLQADIRAKDAIILALAEKLAICSAALSRCAERKILSEIPQITVDSYGGASVSYPQTDGNREQETTMKTDNVIGLWLDTTEGGGPTHNGTWIVSRDLINEKGQVETTRTVTTFDSDEYEYTVVKEEAIRIATKDGLCVIETSESGRSCKCIYVPEGVAPIVG